MRNSNYSYKTTTQKILEPVATLLEGIGSVLIIFPLIVLMYLFIGALIACAFHLVAWGFDYQITTSFWKLAVGCGAAWFIIKSLFSNK